MAKTAPKKSVEKLVGKMRMLSLSDIDGRTRAAKHAAETRDAIVGDLGGADGLSTVERIMCENLAVSSAILRDMHVRWLHGESIDPGAMASMENLFNRTAQILGTKRRPKDVTSLSVKLAEKNKD